MQAPPSASPGSPSRDQAAAQITHETHEQRQKSEISPAKVGTKLLEAVLKAQGRGFFALPEIQALRLVSKDLKTTVDHLVPFLQLTLKIEDFSAALTCCPHLLTSVEKLSIFTSYKPGNPSELVQFATQINASLKYLDLDGNIWGSPGSWGQIVAERLIPRLTALTELKFPGGYSSEERLSGIFRTLADNSNLTSLQKLTIGSYSQTNPEIRALAFNAFSKLSKLESLDLQGSIRLGLHRGPAMFPSNCLPALKHLRICGDYYESEDYLGDNEYGYTVIGPSDHFKGNKLPQWPQLESLDIHGIGEQWFFDALTSAPWFSRLKKLHLSKAALRLSRGWMYRARALHNVRALNTCLDLEELVIGFFQDVVLSLTELRFPKLKKFECIKEDPLDDPLDQWNGLTDQYTPINIGKNFPALESFRLQLAKYDEFDTYIDKLIDLTAPPSSPAFKSFALEGAIQDAGLRTTIYKQWMPHLETVKLRFNTFQEMQHLLSVLKEQGADAAPMWPLLSSFTLILNESGTQIQVTEAQLSAYFRDLASFGAHFPALVEFTFKGSERYEPMPLFKPLLKAARKKTWPRLKSISLEVEDWSCVAERWYWYNAWTQKTFTIDDVMTMEESELEIVEGGD